MKLIPKLNAPGRLDSAQNVIQFLLENDVVELKKQARKFVNDNSTRQLATEEIIKDIYAQMCQEDNSQKRSLIFKGNWPDGIVGVAAARLKEKFYCPSILFTKTKDGLYKGSGRSINGLDMYKMFDSLGDVIESFGGHAMACGLLLRSENFDIFKIKTEEYLSMLPRELFIENCEYDATINGIDSNALYEEMQIFEPCLPDEKITFLYEESCIARPFKELSPHIQIIGNELDIKGFYNYINYLNILNNQSIKKQLLINPYYDYYARQTVWILKDLKILSDFDNFEPLLDVLYGNKKVEELSDSVLKGLSSDREIFSFYYKHIKNHTKTTETFENFYHMLYHSDMNFRQLIASLIVFSELKLLNINLMPFSIRINNTKTDLMKSPFYQRIYKQTKI